MGSRRRRSNNRAIDRKQLTLSNLQESILNKLNEFADLQKYSFTTDNCKLLQLIDEITAPLNRLDPQSAKQLFIVLARHTYGRPLQRKILENPANCENIFMLDRGQKIDPAVGDIFTEWHKNYQIELTPSSYRGWLAWYFLTQQKDSARIKEILNNFDWKRLPASHLEILPAEAKLSLLASLPDAIFTDEEAASKIKSLTCDNVKEINTWLSSATSINSSYYLRKLFEISPKAVNHFIEQQTNSSLLKKNLISNLKAHNLTSLHENEIQNIIIGWIVNAENEETRKKYINNLDSSFAKEIFISLKETDEAIQRVILENPHHQLAIFKPELGKQYQIPYGADDLTHEPDLGTYLYKKQADNALHKFKQETANAHFGNWICWYNLLTETDDEKIKKLLKIFRVENLPAEHFLAIPLRAKTLLLASLPEEKMSKISAHQIETLDEKVITEKLSSNYSVSTFLLKNAFNLFPDLTATLINEKDRKADAISLLSYLNETIDQTTIDNGPSTKLSSLFVDHDQIAIEIKGKDVLAGTAAAGAALAGGLVMAPLVASAGGAALALAGAAMMLGNDAAMESVSSAMTRVGKKIAAHAKGVKANASSIISNQLNDSYANHPHYKLMDTAIYSRKIFPANLGNNRFIINHVIKNWAIHTHPEKNKNPEMLHFILSSPEHFKNLLLRDKDRFHCGMINLLKEGFFKPCEFQAFLETLRQYDQEAADNLLNDGICPFLRNNRHFSEKDQHDILELIQKAVLFNKKYAEYSEIDGNFLAAENPILEALKKNLEKSNRHDEVANHGKWNVVSAIYFKNPKLLQFFAAQAEPHEKTLADRMQNAITNTAGTATAAYVALNAMVAKSTQSEMQASGFGILAGAVIIGGVATAGPAAPLLLGVLIAVGIISGIMAGLLTKKLLDWLFNRVRESVDVFINGSKDKRMLANANIIEHSNQLTSQGEYKKAILAALYQNNDEAKKARFNFYHMDCAFRKEGYAINYPKPIKTAIDHEEQVALTAPEAKGNFFSSNTLYRGMSNLMHTLGFVALWPYAWGYRARLRSYEKEAKKLPTHIIEENTNLLVVKRLETANDSITAIRQNNPTIHIEQSPSTNPYLTPIKQKNKHKPPGGKTPLNNIEECATAEKKIATPVTRR